MNKDTKIRELKEQNELYKQFIISTHGPEAINRLNMEYAVLKTNERLEEYNKEQQFKRIQQLLEYR